LFQAGVLGEYDLHVLFVQNLTTILQVYGSLKAAGY
jgi:hypothetical protein